MIVVGYVPTPEGRAASTPPSTRPPPVTGCSWSTPAGATPYADPRFAQDHHLDEVRALLASAGVEHEVVQRMRGHEAADEVLETVRETGADLVVIGVRHRSPVGKALLGSTAQRILLGPRARCSPSRPSGRTGAEAHSGLTSGKRMVSLMPRPVMAISSRSRPIPIPPAGGIPYSIARRKSSSRGCIASASRLAASSDCATKRFALHDQVDEPRYPVASSKDRT